MKIAIISQDAEASWRRHMELYNSDKQHLQQIRDILHRNGISVSTWSSVKEYLTGRGMRNTEDELVFSLIENCFERNRPGLIPSLWELAGIPYIGSDAYGFTITADKLLFQSVCRKIGLKCPQGFEITSCDIETDIQKKAEESHLSFPMVLKYRYGTMSYGLTIVENIDALISKAKKLILAETESSVVCQEYIPGMEAAVPIVGTGKSARALALIQYADPNQNPIYLYDRTWKTDLDDLVELIPFPHDYLLTQPIITDDPNLKKKKELLIEKMMYIGELYESSAISTADMS